MSSYDADLQAAVDSTSVARDSGETGDLAQVLREHLADRGVETSDEAWIQRTVEGIKANTSYLVEGEPDDFVPRSERD